jgi:hypothetical protein
MRTEKAKGKTRAAIGDMRVFMSLLDLYDACLRNAGNCWLKAAYSLIMVTRRGRLPLRTPAGRKLAKRR